VFGIFKKTFYSQIWPFLIFGDLSPLKRWNNVRSKPCGGVAACLPAIMQQVLSSFFTFGLYANQMVAFIGPLLKYTFFNVKTCMISKMVEHQYRLAILSKF
jgi:hypothetical protein